MSQTSDPADVGPGRCSKRAAGTERWVKPHMVVEVAFGEWTPDGKVRHATFKGVRADKAADSIRREQSAPPPAAAKAPAAKRALTIKISNPDRVTGGRPALELLVGKRDSYVIVAQLSTEFLARLVDRWPELRLSGRRRCLRPSSRH